MPILPLRIPPGIFRNGTEYQAKGRWYDANLVRWTEGAMKPVGGWDALQTPGSANLLAGSSDFTDVAWTGTATVTVNTAVAPDGTLTADSVSDGSIAAVDGLSQVIVISENGYYTSRLYVRQATAPVVRMLTTFSGGTLSADAAMAVLLDPLSGQFIYEEGVADVSTVAVEVVEEAGYWRVDATYENLPDGDYIALTLRVDPAARAAGNLLGFVALNSPTGSNTFWGAGIFRIPSGNVHLREPVRGLITWRDNLGVGRLIAGAVARIWTYAQGGLRDLTPTGFTAGGDQALATDSLYGTGVYGTGAYGVGDPTVTTVIEAQSWQLDTFGQFPVACAISDGKLYYWDLDSETSMVEVHASAPVDCAGVVVTPERFLVALGAGGDPRMVQWADQQSLSVWAPTSENQAGDFPLATTGTLLAGRRARSETLLWTSQDVWAMRYVGGTLVYSFQQVGTNCGPISRRAMSMVDAGRAIWMGNQSFFIYNGFVQPIACEVQDFLFNNLNTAQTSQIHSTTIAENHEVWWFYPSAGSTTVDSYVVFNYMENTWSIGQLNRTAGVDRGALGNPIMADRFGTLYEHERGTSYGRPSGGSLVPFAESGPIEIGEGENTMMVRQILPDETMLGDMEATMYTKIYPTDTEIPFGPFNPAAPTSTRLSGRQVRLRVDQVSPGWRFGVPRLEVIPRGRR